MMPRKFADELFSAHYLSVIEGCCEDDKTAALSTMAIKRRLLKLGVDIHSTAVQASTKVELRQMLREAATSCELREIKMRNSSEHDGDHGSFFGDDETAAQNYEKYLTRIGCLGRRDAPPLQAAVSEQGEPLGAHARLGEAFEAMLENTDGALLTKEKLNHHADCVTNHHVREQRGTGDILSDGNARTTCLADAARTPQLLQPNTAYNTAHGAGRWHRARQQRE